MTGARFPDLDGASVLVTGGGSGIGAALVEGFAAQGARVAFIDLLEPDDLCSAIEARTGNRPLGLRCDLTDTNALRAAVAKVAAAHGPVAGLVNNAAWDDRHATADVDEIYWNKVVDVNLRAVFFATQAVLPGMRAAGRGAIVNFSSISYMMGLGDYPLYVASKAGITALTRGWAREFGGDGIRVNGVAPGWVLTERQKRLWARPEALAAMMDRQCLKRHLDPADMVGPVLFLASDVSAMMTGQVIAVDGGVVTVSA
ncbi:SDR family NAD(P)-dependent oxidoreductase [Thetidibacter halocola]|uniref:SDR family oxidoreductase n=1 Tax=Thetidibacter halocola TaxID=2827239 RepID=A0A8J7WDL4_9RHOB|nr:SDR family oxidoreductase [Thetidibacter halocola]MBS0123249.1 SDR family oxidoreductase [Thetidibacter halocola]